MKQFNLQEYLANPSRQVVTREGRKVRIVCTDFDNPDFPIVGEIQGNKWPLSFATNGEAIKGKPSACDLFFSPEKHVGWINLPALLPEEQGDLPHPFKIPVFDSEVKAREARENVERCRIKIEDNAHYYSVKIEWEE